MSSQQNVLIYSEYWSSKGGGEKYLLCMVEALLGAGFDVTILAQEGSFDRDYISQYFHVDISRADIVFVPGSLRMLRARAEAISGGFDICIAMANYRTIRSHARHTFVVLQIPYGPITYTGIAAKASSNVREAAKDYYRKRLLGRLRETHAVLVYSRFVHDALDTIHGVPSTVLPPPIDDFSAGQMHKERIILSVGRIFRGLYNDKRYDVLIDAFKRLHAELPSTTWQYRIAGSCGSDAASQEYLEELRASVTGLPVYFHINSSYEDLKRYYNQATLFWHAAGYGVDEGRHPERAEHFGMSTLEAMSASGIPLVVHRGGQKEIVSHAESGYLWNSVDELVDHSLTLIRNPSLLPPLQEAARMRFTEFDRAHFSARVLSLIPNM